MLNLPTFSSSSPPMQGNRQWGLQSVHHTWSVPVLLPLGDDSSLFLCSRVDCLQGHMSFQGHRLLSSEVHSSSQISSPARASHSVTASFSHPPALDWGPLWAAGETLLHHEPPWSAEESQFQCLEHILPCFPARPGCLKGSFICSHSSLCLQLQGLVSFLNLLSQRY